MATQLFQSSSQTVEWLRKIAQPMIDHEGTWLMNTGIARVGLPKSVIDTLLYGGAEAHDTGKQIVYHFVRDGKRYALKVGMLRSTGFDCVFTWDHRDGNLAF